MKQLLALIYLGICLAGCKSDKANNAEFPYLNKLYGSEHARESAYAEYYQYMEGLENEPSISIVNKIHKYYDEILAEDGGKSNWEDCTKGHPQLQHYHQKLLSEAKRLAMPVNKIFTQEAIADFDCNNQLNMLFLFESEIIRAYYATCSGFYKSSIPIKIFCQDTILLGDTVTVLTHTDTQSTLLLADSLISSEGAVFVPNGPPATLAYSQTRTIPKQQLIVFQCVPTQIGQHFVQVPFVLQTKTGSQHAFMMGRGFVVRGRKK